MRNLDLEETKLVAGGRQEVIVPGRRMGPSDPSFAAFLNDLGAPPNAHSLLAAAENGRPGDGREDSVREEAEERSAETAEKLEEVTVEASRCGMPVAELFVLEQTQAGPAWQKCFQNLSDEDRKNLKLALDIIAAGFKPSDGFTPLAVAFKFVFKDELEMVKELSKAVAANDGRWFGENLATLSKGGWDSQLILGLIKGVFKVTNR
jgi:hypothetical protein